MHVYIYPDSEITAFDRSAFLGFTLDADQFAGNADTSCLPELNHPVVKNLCRELKPATIRIGGCGIDRFYFVDDDPDGSAPTPGKYEATLDRRKCDALGDFCRAAGADLMLGLPMRHGDIDNARRLAAYFVKERRDRVPFLEFGNEPDWGWGEDAPSYPRQARRFHKELAPLFPDQRWMGGYGGRFFPFGVCNPDSRPYMEFVRQCHDLVDVFTVHYYVCNSDEYYANSALLTDAYAADIAANRLNELRQILDMHGIGKPIAVNEFNTYANQGLDGVSNAMPAAVWTADIIGRMARQGVAACNIQCGFAKQHGNQLFYRYAMIDTRGQQPVVNPHYYSFYLWSRHMGNIILASSGGRHPVAVHATRSARDDTTLLVMLINKSADTRQEAALDIAGRAPPAGCEIITLQGDGSAGREASINGVKPGSDGRMPPITFAAHPLDANGQCRLILPPCSVSVVRLAMKQHTGH